ncbi:transaldolase, partial [candidate division KSB1 bacterium]|nr:transaldolase [candidate division KSB1 bacterium]
MNRIDKLAKQGQAVWIDYIHRRFIASGELQNLIDEGISGLTSNPSIFQKAIAGSDTYTSEIENLARAGKSTAQIYETLAIEDIQKAADLFRPVYERTQGREGYVSLEIDPALAHDTRKTIEAAKALAGRVDRSNLMIKIPATEEGIPAVRELIGLGMNINVTLIFGMESYRRVVQAYIEGLENRTEGDLSGIASVASFFVSRLDTAVEEQLQNAGRREWSGKIAVANCKAAYREFQNVFSGGRWTKLAARGAQLQRLLWASTSAKN